MNLGTIGKCVGVLLLWVVGPISTVWAAQSNTDEQIISGGLTEVSAGASAAQYVDQSDQRGWLDNLYDECACQDKNCSTASKRLFFLPSCFAKVLLDPCSHCEDGEVGLIISSVILAVCFAIFTRLAAKGYRRSLFLSFALFLAILLAAAIGAFALWEDPITNSDIVEFVIVLLASAFLAGLLAFWTRYMLDLLVVTAGASLVALLTYLSIGLQSVQTLTVAAGIAGGVWLYWWRDLRPKRTGFDGGQTPTDGGRPARSWKIRGASARRDKGAAGGNQPPSGGP